MAHLDSKHTLQVNLANAVPSSGNLEISSEYSIQGNTTVTFVLSDIQDAISPTGVGIKGIEVKPEVNDLGSLTDSTFYPAIFSSTGSTTALPFSTFEHTYYSTVSSVSSLSAEFNIFYQQEDASLGPLVANQKIHFKTTADNIVDRNITLLNSQMFTIEGDPVPMFNIETDENIIYPLTYYQFLSSERQFLGIYLNTDEETLPDPLSTDFLADTRFWLSSALSTVGAIALSGGGFTLQGQTGRQYTYMFNITGDGTAITELSSDALSAYADIEIPYINLNLGKFKTYQTVFKAITSTVFNQGILGDEGEFLSITTSLFDSLSRGGLVKFNHGNLLPPAATVYALSAATVIRQGTFESLEFGDWYYRQSGVLDRFYTYPASGYGLSASNRISTDPDGDNITAL